MKPTTTNNETYSKLVSYEKVTTAEIKHWQWAPLKTHMIINYDTMILYTKPQFHIMNITTIWCYNFDKLQKNRATSYIEENTKQRQDLQIQKWKRMECDYP